MVEEEERDFSRDMRKCFADEMRRGTMIVLKGGGVRGSYSAAILESIMEVVRKNILALRDYKEPDRPKVYDDVEALYRFHCVEQWDLQSSHQDKAGSSNTTGIEALGLIPLHRIAQEGVATSTGSILLAASATPGISTRKPLGIEEVLQFYREDAKEIFKSCSPNNCHRTLCCKAPNYLAAMLRWLCCCGCFGCCKNCWGVCGPRFEHEALERILMEKLGETTFNSCLMDINFTAYDFRNNRPILLSKQRTPELPVWQGVRASTAAPTFFIPHTIENYSYHDEIVTSHLMDGALVENFPILSAYFLQLNGTANDEDQEQDSTANEELQNNRDGKINNRFIIAVGTGLPRKERPQNFKYSGSLEMITPLVDILMSASGKSAHLHVQTTHPAYFLLDGPIGRRLDALDDPGNIPELINKGKEYVERSLSGDIGAPLEKRLPEEMMIGVRDAVAHLPGGIDYERMFREYHLAMLEESAAILEEDVSLREELVREMRQELDALPPLGAWQGAS